MSDFPDDYNPFTEGCPVCTAELGDTDNCPCCEQYRAGYNPNGTAVGSVRVSAPKPRKTMSDKTGIEWTDATWNPTKGCDRVSPGCDHCYAMTQAVRLKGMGSAGYQLDGDPRTSGPGFLAHEWPAALDQPLRWTRPRRIFVNSMADLFHDNISDEFIARVFAVMARAQQHTFQVLTKRHARMRSLLSSSMFRRQMYDALVALDYAWINANALPYPLENVWLGVSTEDQQWANIRIPALLDTPAAVRFISAEPLLGEISLFANTNLDTGTLLDWVIVGGESGPGARPMNPRWARQLRNECADYSIPFLFKQWGNWSPDPKHAAGVGYGPERHYFDDETFVRNVGKHAAGRELDGRLHDGYPDLVGAGSGISTEKEKQQ